MKFALTTDFGMTQFIDGETLFDAVIKSNSVGNNFVSILRYDEWIRLNSFRYSVWYRIYRFTRKPQMKSYDVVNGKWQIMTVKDEKIGHRDLEFYEWFNLRLLKCRTRRYFYFFAPCKKGSK